MIKLTRLNGEEFVVNAELIRFVESRPDTYVTLTTDDRLIVRESVDEVMQRVVSYARHIRMLPETTAERASIRRSALSHNRGAFSGDAPSGGTPS